MKKDILLVLSVLLLSCNNNSNPVLPNGEVCQGKNGTLSLSGRWQEFNMSNSCLPSNTIRCLEVDHNNNLWIGTDNGLVFYDGTKWIIFNTFNSRLPSNGISSLACEGDTIWVGTNNNGGLARFDGHSWTIYNSKNSPLGELINVSGPASIGLVITTVKIDSKHNIWLGTNYEGVYKFDKAHWDRYYPTNLVPISSPSIEKINIAAENIIWISHFEPAGIDKFDGNIWTNYSPANSPNPFWHIHDIQIDERNTKWFASDFGLARFDDMSWTFFDTTNSRMQDENINSISLDSKNHLWLGTFSGTLINMNENSWIVYYMNDATKLTVPYNSITCVNIDKFDNKWVGTYGGLYKFNQSGL